MKKILCIILVSITLCIAQQQSTSDNRLADTLSYVQKDVVDTVVPGSVYEESHEEYSEPEFDLEERSVVELVIVGIAFVASVLAIIFLGRD